METTPIQIEQRPWQGTVIGVFQIIGIFVLTILALAFIFGAGFIGALISKYAQDVDFPVGVIGAGAMLIIGLVVFLPLVILNIFITIGIFKGKKWAVIIALIFTSLGILGNLVSFNIFGLVLSGFILYCEIACLKEPFYK